MLLNRETGIKVDFPNKQINTLSSVSTLMCSDSVKVFILLRKVDVPAEAVLG